MRLVILEGVDGAGKSTLADRIRREAEARGLEAAVAHFAAAREGEDEVRRFASPIADAGFAGADVCICDRSVYSELVYGPVFRGGVVTTPHELAVIESLYYHPALESTSLVLCHPPLETVIERLLNRDDETAEHIEKVPALYTAYSAIGAGVCRPSDPYAAAAVRDWLPYDGSPDQYDAVIRRIFQ